MNTDKKKGEFRLAVIEIDYHPEVLRNLSKALSATSIETSCYTTSELASSVHAVSSPDKINWIVKDPSQSIRQFIDLHLEEINKNDAVLFNTLASEFKYFSKVSFRPPVILRVHNASAYLNPEPNYNIIFSAFQLFKDASHFVRKVIGEREPHFRKKFVERVDYFCFPDSMIEKNVRERGWLKDRKTLPPIPFTMHNSQYVKKAVEDRVTISVIGSIDPRRRDYKLLSEALEASIPKLQTPVSLHLLGRPRGSYGEEIISQIQKLTSPKFTFHSYRGFVPEEEFEAVLKKTDFLIIPALEKTRYTIYTEEYGKTKISGNIYDMIRFGKPALVPSSYPVENGPDKLCASFGNKAELIDLLAIWVDNREFSRRLENIDEALKDYQPINVHRHIELIFTQLLSGTLKSQ